MKALLSNIFILLTVVAVHGQAKSEGVTYGMTKSCYDAVIGLDVAKMSEHFGSSIEIITSAGGGIYSRKQAEQVLLSYFDVLKNEKCVLLQDKKSAGARLAIGEIRADGKKIRLYVLTQQQNNKSVIQQIRLEE